MITNADVNFATYCQPCNGVYEKDEECDTLPNCEDSGTDDTSAYLHHHCCDKSTAFRVRPSMCHYNTVSIIFLDYWNKLLWERNGF